MEFACTPNGNPGSIPNILVMNVTVNDSASPAVGDLFYTASDFPAAAGYRSQQQVSLLMGAKSVDSESKRQTDHSLHQQPSQTTQHQPPELTPPVSLRCHHPGFPSPSHLNSASISPASPCQLELQQQRGPRFTSQNSNVQMTINVHTPGHHGRCSVDCF